MTRGDVEGGIEVGGAASDVVMGAPFGQSRAKRKDWGGAVEGLDLGLLVDAQHQRSVGGIDVKPHHIPDFLDKERVGLSLKVSTRWGFRPKARQIRETADWLIPVALAIERVDQ